MVEQHKSVISSQFFLGDYVCTAVADVEDTLFQLFFRSYISLRNYIPPDNGRTNAYINSFIMHKHKAIKSCTVALKLRSL